LAAALLQEIASDDAWPWLTMTAGGARIEAFDLASAAGLFKLLGAPLVKAVVRKRTRKPLAARK
jgi:hypothetical protein